MAEGFLDRATRIAAAALALLAPTGGAAQDSTPLSAEEHAAWLAIGRVNVGGFNTRGTCTGTLIAADLVLTAAHCVPTRALRPDDPEQVHFVAGWYLGDYAAHRTGRALHIHPEYVRGRSGLQHLDTDVALVELDAPIPADMIEPLALAEMPTFADDVEILAYSNRRSGALARAGPCIAIGLDENVLGMTCGVEGGNSGAPVLRRKENGWEVVAVAVARNRGDGGFRSFAVRVPDVLFEMAGRKVP